MNSKGCFDRDFHYFLAIYDFSAVVIVLELMCLMCHVKGFWSSEMQCFWISVEQNPISFSLVLRWPESILMFTVLLPAYPSAIFKFLNFSLFVLAF